MMPTANNEIQCKLLRYYCVMRTNCDLPDLQAFCALVRCGGFNKTADLLALSPSALSRRISKLEEALGGRLVERTTRTMVLTPLGLALHERLAPLLDSLDDCLAGTARMARGEGGQMTVACITTVAYSLFPAALSRLRQRHPDVRVDLRDDTGARVRDAVLRREAEFGITVLWEDEPELACQSLRDDPYVLACAPGHPMAARAQAAWADLAGQRVLALRRSSANRQQIDAALAVAGVPAPWFDEVEHLSSMIGFLEHGGWMAVLPRLALAATTRVATIPLTAPTIARRICLVRRRDTTLSRPARALWDELARSITAPPSAPAPA